MIINCGNRRIVSYKYGWKIEIQKRHKETRKLYWDEDRPAYPATLAQALEMVFERMVKEEGEIAPSELLRTLRDASGQVRHYMELARQAA